MIDKMYDELFLVEKDGEKLVKAWVYEDEFWTYREVTEQELKTLYPLLNFDLSSLSRG